MLARVWIVDFVSKSDEEKSQTAFQPSSVCTFLTQFVKITHQT